MSQTLRLLLITLFVSAATVAIAQDPPADAPAQPVSDTAADEASDQAAQLEAELGKLKDDSPEAADVMLELVDLYHAHGRVFGLVRIGSRFVSSHAAHERHAEVMLKLLDGQQAASRNADAVAICRQFLLRYPEHEACPAVERVLARTIDQTQNRLEAGEAFELVWNRAGDTPEGRQAAQKAINVYVAINNQQGFQQAGELAEAVLDKLLVDEYVERTAWQGVINFQRAGDRARSNQVGAKMIAKGLPTTPASLRQLHSYMADNYLSLGQKTNAVESFKKARAIEDSQFLNSRQIAEMYHGAAKGTELDAEVNTYFQKYPQAEDRFALRGYVALAYLRDGAKDQALALIRQLLPFDARTHNLASTFISQNGNEPEKLADSEAVLLDAIAKNPREGGYLRHALALELYRDRLQNMDKARQVAREFLSTSPTNDGYSQNVIHWLLYNPVDDAGFAADLDLALAARRKYLELASLRSYLPGWVQQAKGNKDHQARAAIAETKLKAQDDDPLVKLWIASEANNAEGNQARQQLLQSPQIEQLSQEQLWIVNSALASSLVSSGNNDDRVRGAGLYAELVKRFPAKYDAAGSFVYYAAHYGAPELCKAAVEHMLTLEPQKHDYNYETCYRLLHAADRAADGELTKRAYAWVKKCWDQFGMDIRYADSIGDYLAKYQAPELALEVWKRAYPTEPNNYYARTCAERVLRPLMGDARKQFLLELIAAKSDYHGTYAMWLADDYYKAGDLANFQKTLLDSQTVQKQRPFAGWGIEEYPAGQWVSLLRSNPEAKEADKRLVYTLVRDLDLGRPSAAAQLALLELPPETPDAEQKPIERLIAWQQATTLLFNDTTDWDWLVGYAQAAMARKDYAAVSSLVGGMLENIPSIDEGRKKVGRDMLAQSYARMGGVGLAVDESSPIAPLMQAALYLRLGDQRMAFDTYLVNKALFDQHREELPVDLILFVAESHVAAGGDENHDRAEDILRGWLVKFSEATDLDASVKASVQLLLAKNYFKAQRFDVARSEYLSAKNRYPDTPEAIEADFGIGECYMAQKVYDQAEAVFEVLSQSKDRDVVIRATFLRGVLANRRGDRDEARDIFRSVLEMVPNIDLANEALFNLAEVYGAEERYIDQLELLRTVGRLGRISKKWHQPGLSLSIVVYDPDLGTSRHHTRIPVRVTTQPGGDEETVYLYTTPGGKGLFRADLETELGQAKKGTKRLELTGKDLIQCDYPPEFKAEFRTVPIADTEIRIAAGGELEASSSEIIDREKETLTQRLEREAREEAEADERVSQGRPTNQVKPGNVIYLRVKDADRDLSDESDRITLKMSAQSGDQVQVQLAETGAHSGVFQGQIQTGELPAGALASDTAIDHSPLMAIDQDPATAWVSEPDGATPKWLAVDMKDLRYVDHVTISSPDAKSQAPVRGELLGSHDGRFWFRISKIPAELPIPQLAGETGRMSLKVYQGNYTGFSTWQQVVDLSKNSKPIVEKEADVLDWSLKADHADAKTPHAVIWQGKFFQPRQGAVRFSVQGAVTALAIGDRLELPLGPSGRTADVWLDAGTHDLTIFAAGTDPVQPLAATRAREDHNAAQVVLSPFRANDFDLDQPGATPAAPREAPRVTTDNGVWDFQFDTYELRHVKLIVDEYVGEAVAVNHVQISGEEGQEKHIPTEADILALAHNNVLEIAAGDVVTAAYTDEFTTATGDRSQLLTAELQATYFNAAINPIAYDLVRIQGGGVQEIRKELIRIDPGEKIVIEVVDYDLDQTNQEDKLRLQVAVNDGEPIELIAQETDEFSGVFTKEVFTSAQPEEGKLQVKPGDRVYCTYLDAQNTFPGHAVPRETVVFVNEPAEGSIRIVDTRYVRPPMGASAADVPPQIIYLPADEEAGATTPVNGANNSPRLAKVAFEVPLTVEVYDRDAAKDSKSTVTVQLQTTDGAKLDVECEISPSFGEPATPETTRWALEEGRFIGQVILQLGGKNSPSLVPLTSDMPRDMIGGPLLSEEEVGRTGANLVTRVLNLTGKDRITANYKDERRPGGPSQNLAALGRLVANGALACTDRDYDKPVEQLHVGEKLFLRVTDADLDTSDERDAASVTIAISAEDGKVKEQETVELFETLAHSGVFTGSITLKPSEQPQPGNVDAADPAVETFFGDNVKVAYLDKAASTESGELELTAEAPVVIGTDGLVAAFSKTFTDETLAVETQFHIAESYFELFKSHKQLARGQEQQGDLENGRRVLREVMEDYPNPKYTPRIAYLLGQFAQELERWDEAIESYRIIVRQYPDHSLAADAQFKLAQCYEKRGEFDQALEEYVTLAATYPKSPLIASVMIRICNFFFKDDNEQRNYQVAAQVAEKFLEKFEGHEYAPKMAFLIGQCFYKDKQYVQSAKAFQDFAKYYPDDPLAADAVFWAGENHRLSGNAPEAFRRFYECHTKFGTTDAAKYARGRLALPEMQAQFESEARTLEDSEE